ncbi:MAG TPA: protein kinase, partial [Myxococcales bacterium]
MSDPAHPPTSDSLLAPGAQVDHYRVVRLAGRGGMGEVYLARDLRLGRKVALKVIRGEAVADPQARERFLLEARATAQLNHPHVVIVYGVGEHQGQPYLAMEYLEGCTLADRLAESPPSPAEALRLGLAIAEAIAEAHARQILHRDLKPANVVIPKDGRLRVVDFGLAKFMGGGESDAELAASPGAGAQLLSTLSGTPMYMSPQMWAGAPGSMGDDVWALGMVLHELLVGRHPIDESLSIAQMGTRIRFGAPLVERDLALPPELVALLARCLDRDPAARPDAGTVARELGDAISGTRQDSGVSRPFRGLLPFSEQHAGLFFGRGTEVEAFLERLRDEAVLPVVGPSGAGKSSFVQAGVIPRLREQGRWIVLRLRPGRHPFRALAARLAAGERSSLPSLRGSGSDATLRAATVKSVPTDLTETESVEIPEAELAAAQGEEQLARELTESPARLALWLSALAEKERSPVLLFVDQLEEAFTLGEGAEARSFVEAVSRAADDPQGPVRVVFTLRDDFLGRAAESQAAREALSRVTVLRAPGPEALCDILTRPVAALGYRYEPPELASQMVREVEGEPAALSLLQFAGELLWERRDRKDRLLRREAYEKMGGVAGALATHADAVLQGLSDDEVAAARALLLRLVTQDGFRRMVARRDALEGLGPRAAAVLDRLVEARMVVARKSSAEGGEVSLELVHEALVRAWQRLARWVDEGREDLVFLDDAGRAAELWERRGRRREEVWRGQALSEALRRADRLGVRLPERVAAFLDAGRRAARRRVRARRVALGATIAVLLGVALVLLAQARRAEALRAQAEDRGAEALLEGARAAWLRGDGLEARAKLRVALEHRDSPMARGLWWQLEQSPVLWRRQVGPVISELDVSPDGSTIAAGKQDSSIALVDAATGSTRFLRGNKDQVLGVRFSPDGASLGVLTWGGELAVWDLSTNQPLVVSREESGGRGVAFSPDGRLLASTRADGAVRVWDWKAARLERTLAGHASPSSGVAFSPDGTRLAASCNDGAARVWDLASGRELLVLKGHVGRSNTLRYSPDGKSVATGGHDATVRVWDAETGAPRFVMHGHQARVMALAWSRSGSLLASSSTDGTVRLWDPARGAEVALLSGLGSAAPAYGLSFGKDDAVLAAGASDGNLLLLRPRNAAAARPFSALSQREVAFSPDGRQLATGPEDGVVQLWDVASGEIRRVLRGHSGAVHGIAYSPDGTLLATGAEDRLVRLWDPRTGALVRVLEGHTAELLGGLAFSPDGRRLVTASSDGSLRSWDPADGRVAWTSRLVGARRLAYSPDGTRLAAASVDRMTRVFDAATGALTASFTDHADELWGVAFHPDGRRLATSGSDGRVVVRDLVSGEKRELGPVGGRTYWLSFSPDGRWLGVPVSDGTARLFDLSTGEVVILRGHRSEVNALRFSPDSSRAATTSDDGTVRVWESATGRPVWRLPLVRASPPELYSHRGWARLDGAAPGEAGEKWRSAVEASAQLAAQAEGGSRLCLATFGQQLEIWDLAGDRRLAGAAAPGALRQVAALPHACLSLGWDGKVTLLSEDGSVRQLGEGASAAVRDGGEILVAQGREVVVFDEQGRERARLAADLGATALVRQGEALAVGFKDGNIELEPTVPGQARSQFRFEDVPASAVERLVSGPMGTLAAGYANGMVGVWDAANGTRLHVEQLHGPVAHLTLAGQTLYAATE